MERQEGDISLNAKPFTLYFGLLLQGWGTHFMLRAVLDIYKTMTGTSFMVAGSNVVLSFT